MKNNDLRILLQSIVIMLILISVIICVAGCSSFWDRRIFPEKLDDAYKAVADDVNKVYEGDYLIILTEAYAKSTVYPDSKFYYGYIFYGDTEDIEHVFVRIEPDGTISVFD